MDYACFVRWVLEPPFCWPWKAHPPLEQNCRVRRNTTPSRPVPRPAKRPRRLAHKVGDMFPSDDALSGDTQNSQKSMVNAPWILSASCDGFRKRRFDGHGKATPPQKRNGQRTHCCQLVGNYAALRSCPICFRATLQCLNSPTRAHPQPGQ